jgi:hypothetical protein
MVRFDADGTAGFGEGPAGAAASTAGGGAFGFVTRNEWPHLGHRIFRPAGGTRRSSIWYGALHDSHSTFSISPAEGNTRPSHDAIPRPFPREVGRC